MEGTKQVAQRMVNAENAFLGTIKNIVGCTDESAAKVLAIYRKYKLVKLDPIGGVINVKHGMYLDVDVILNAIAMKD